MLPGVIRLHADRAGHAAARVAPGTAASETAHRTGAAHASARPTRAVTARYTRLAALRLAQPLRISDVNGAGCRRSRHVRGATTSRGPSPLSQPSLFAERYELRGLIGE